MRRMYDAATPPGRPPQLEVVAGYIGGDTPHVWSDSEWAAQLAPYRLPIFVRSNPDSHDPHADAAAAVAWLRAHHVPAGCAVALDLEMAVNRGYVSTFDADMTAAGYRTVKYGSLSTIFGNPRTAGGTWTADWTGSASLDHVGDTVATQYASDTMLGTGYDLSVVADTLYLWDSHGTQPPPAQEDPMPEYLSVSRNAPETGGPEERAIHFDVTHEDTGKLRDPAKPTPGICDGGKNGAFCVVDVDLSGTGRARLVEVDPTKSWAVSKTYGWHPLGEAFTEAGCVSPGQHLWVHVDATDGVTGAVKVIYRPR